jgi:hypothetical protein
MNAEEDNMRGKQRQAIQQSTITLPYFDEEVPVLYLSSTPSVPAIALARCWDDACSVECELFATQQGGPRPLYSGVHKD